LDALSVDFDGIISSTSIIDHLEGNWNKLSSLILWFVFSIITVFVLGLSIEVSGVLLLSEASASSILDAYIIAWLEESSSTRLVSEHVDYNI